MRCIPVLAAALFVFGCTRTVYVPREVVKTEYRDRVQYDSVYRRDSIMVHEKGDTVYVYVDRWRDKYHLVRDTVRLVDSLGYPVPYEVVKEVKHIPKVYRWGFWFSIAVLGVGVFKLSHKFKLF